MAVFLMQAMYDLFSFRGAVSDSGKVIVYVVWCRV
jgi:hypothetical protein